MQKSLSAVRAVIPPHCMRPHAGRALLYMASGIIFYSASVAFAWFVWEKSIYWLYPISWFVGGTASTSLFVLAHDCGHYSILKSRRIMDVLGHVLLLPVCYPFYAWKHSHDAHHKYTNLLKREDSIYFDNAWIPETIEEYETEKSQRPFYAFLYRIARRFPPLGAWMHHGHYLLSSPELYREDHRKKAVFSIWFVLIGMLTFGPAISFLSGSWFGAFHFWFLPALCFQFWMAIYTFLHHTAEDVPFLPEGEWTPYRAQVECTVNVLWPRPISFLHGNIDVHLPHHVAANIPAYWLRDAYAAIKNSEFASEVREVRFSPSYYLRQIRQCRLWDTKAKAYAGFPD